MLTDRTGEELALARNPGVNRTNRVARLSLSDSPVMTFSAAELVEEVDGVWTVRDLETGIFGTGSERATALDDFEAALREHLDVLERQPALSEELQAQLRYLRIRLA